MISIIHPSRGRPQKAYETAIKWHTRTSIKFEYVLSLDRSDPLEPEYGKLFNYGQYVTNDNSSLVEATNIAVRSTSGDILVYLSDDFDCPNSWAELILKEFEGVTGPMLLKVDDCLQKFDVPVLTMPIMNRALYNLLGYFFHPDFKSMHCDEHLYQRCARLGVIKKAPYLKFEHWHVSNGKAENDDTYRRSAANWDHGVMMMRKHRRLGFSQ